MDYTANEVLEFIKDNDVKFIRLAFCDIFGMQKNIAIMPDELPRAFENGISFDASAIKGFMNVEKSDLFLVPDPSSLSILPWRPSHGRVVRFLCNIKYPDGTYFEGDARNILDTVVNDMMKLGYICKIGSECEFYLFEMDDLGNPTHTPHDYAGYCDIAPLDKGENVRREICLTLEEMNIIPESSHHEQGPGQNEIDFKYSNAMLAADNLITFKSVVKAVAARNGLYASFMPKPFEDKSGSGLHINMSLFKNGLNIFKNSKFEHSTESENFIAGILNRVCEISAFLNPLVNSYERFGKFEAPKYITWSHQNRSQLIRIPAANGEYSRMELRSPDPSCNPYLAFALLIYAGIEGIKNSIPLENPTNFDLYSADKSTLSNINKLPENLSEALDLAAKSEFIKKVIPSVTVEKYINLKKQEYEKYINYTSKTSFNKDFYFLYI